jgi:ubiquinone biosynthesis protein UbiJ
MAISLDTLVYVRKLREAGFSERQAEGQAEALAAAMTDTFATKPDLRELETRMDAGFAQVNARFEYLERHMDTRFAEQEKRMEVRLTELERRIEIRFDEHAARFFGELTAHSGEVAARFGEINARFGEVTARFGEMTATFDGKLSDLERRMTMRLGGIMVACVGAFSALVSALITLR